MPSRYLLHLFIVSMLSVDGSQRGETQVSISSCLPGDTIKNVLLCFDGKNSNLFLLFDYLSFIQETNMVNFYLFLTKSHFDMGRGSADNGSAKARFAKRNGRSRHGPRVEWRCALRWIPLWVSWNNS